MAFKQKFTPVFDFVIPKEYRSSNPLYTLTLGLSSLFYEIKSGHMVENLIYRRYRREEKINSGRFSDIFKALDTFSNKPVAIKFLHKDYAKLGRKEAFVLRQISYYSNQESPCIQILNCFWYNDSVCLVLPLMDNSLSHITYFILEKHPLVCKQFLEKPQPSSIRRITPFETMKINDVFFDKEEFERIPELTCSISLIQQVAMKISHALYWSHKLGIIHADLKPDNILLRASKKHFYFDFLLSDWGNAVFQHEVEQYYGDFELQSLLYRAPEVLLGIECIEGNIDMWSLGCILVELYTGSPLFSPKVTTDLSTIQNKELWARDCVLKSIHELLGPFPLSIYSKGKFYSRHFNEYNYLKSSVKNNEISTTPHALDISPDVYTKIENHVKRQFSVKLKTNNTKFIHFIMGLLNLNPHKRLRAKEALLHPFLSELFPSELKRSLKLKSPNSTLKHSLVENSTQIIEVLYSALQIFKEDPKIFEQWQDNINQFLLFGRSSEDGNIIKLGNFEVPVSFIKRLVSLFHEHQYELEPARKRQKKF